MKQKARMRENICKQCDWQGLNIQNISTAHTTQQQIIQIKKWAEDLDTSLNKTYRWPAGTWKDAQHH